MGTAAVSRGGEDWERSSFMGRKNRIDIESFIGNVCYGKLTHAFLKCSAPGQACLPIAHSVCLLKSSCVLCVVSALNGVVK